MKTKSKGKILVIDDEEKDRKAIAQILLSENFEVIESENGYEGIEKIKDNVFNLVLLDLVLPDLNGIEVLKEIIKEKPDLPVIMISKYGTIKHAVLATKIGAYDWLVKPVDQETMLLTIRNALEKEKLQRELALLKEEALKKYQMIGVSEPIIKIFNLIEEIARSDVTVLITGESGVGKELVARAIHNKSNRNDEPFIKINCAAIPENLIESELFGYEKGAFTGAVAQKKGKLEIADKATLFLDEIGDLSPSAQAKLLRFLQEGEFERLGSTETIKVNVRIIAATNKNLLEEIEKRNFRADLYYRLNVMSIFVPPLRERKDDILVLADYFLDKYCAEDGVPKKILTPPAIDFLKNLPWKGNVRELENLIARASILVKSHEIKQNDLMKLLASEGK
ncbi:MAG: sigma-54 dependent transcriptional regulator [candidate division WOR-3 bacterium]|nr:sigma-54 dependent transcriptional regulator [candidate division WOR-3 bacterium]